MWQKGKHLGKYGPDHVAPRFKDRLVNMEKLPARRRDPRLIDQLQHTGHHLFFAIVPDAIFDVRRIPWNPKRCRLHPLAGDGIGPPDLCEEPTGDVEVASRHGLLGLGEEVVSVMSLVQVVLLLVFMVLVPLRAIHDAILVRIHFLPEHGSRVRGNIYQDRASGLAGSDEGMGWS